MIRATCESTHLTKRRNLHNDYYSFTFAPFRSADKCRAGQFVHAKLPTGEVYFRRAFSVAAVNAERQEVELIMKVMGRGTRIMAGMKRGDPINLLGPLGAPFKPPRRSERAILIAGGIGFPPLLFLAEQLVAGGHDPKRIVFLYGGRSRIDIVERTRIRRLGVDLQIVTEDGTLGVPGIVTDRIEELVNGGGAARLYGCGPEGMLKAIDGLAPKLGVPGQLSLEAPMPCGIGVCLGCVVPLTHGGHARVCCDGPVFEIGEVEL